MQLAVWIRNGLRVTRVPKLGTRHKFEETLKRCAEEMSQVVCLSQNCR
ncbi:hypothetical protein L798_13625 [Zootermopsis nevadensis]|uniref:Uncharacterized protein n=1 Tax=Zootermopsis nevadensis TaxID=136037 RepID=A0A067R2K7_ZOONE|nr:hypothetical protein L798_13625 [Zootermopsis nevadensis]